MFPTPVEAKVEHPGIHNIRRGSSKTTERRRRVRLQVKWPVCIWVPNASAPVETTTTNLSSDGFYCLFPARLEPGEIVACTVTIPDIPNHAGNQRRRVLECQVRIIRLEAPNKDGDFGLGCHIENFHIATAARSGI
jgi:PilZ domain